MSWVLGVYSVSLYFLTSLWYNLRSYLVDNQAYLVGYLLLTGGISFAVCYRMVRLRLLFGAGYFKLFLFSSRVPWRTPAPLT